MIEGFATSETLAALQGPIGQVLSVRGSEVMVAFSGEPDSDAQRPTVGRFVAISVGEGCRVIGMITETEMMTADGNSLFVRRAKGRVDLMGEIRRAQDDALQFSRGVKDYPAIGDAVALVTRDELQLIYRISARNAIDIGRLHQDETISAFVDVDSLLLKHFAILGSTGVGKSSAVAMLIREAVMARQDLRVFIIDCHNEYGRCFEAKAHVISQRNLKLPFWMFSFEEFTDVLYAGRPVVDEEIEILADLIPIAKNSYTQYKASSDRPLLKKSDPRQTGFTVDTPVPYLLQDLLTLIDERMGRLENRSSRMNYHRLMNRIDTIKNDPRYGFMFENANVGGDTMADLLSTLFRLDPDGKPVSIMQLAGLPAEVVDAVVCLLARLAFDFGLWSDGAIPLLFVCEEAHRYIRGRSIASSALHPTRQRPGPHRQGRPQIRRPPRARDAACGGTRSHHPVPMQHAAGHAHGQRTGSGVAALRGERCRGEPARLRALARDGRGRGLRRRRIAAGPHDLPGAPTPPSAAQRKPERRDHQP